MKMSGLERALDAMAYLERGQPYSLHPEDRKRKLLDELFSVCKELGVAPLVIGGLAVSHHGYVRTTVDVDVLITEKEGAALTRKLKESRGWKRIARGFKNTPLEVELDICIEGRRTSPRRGEPFPERTTIRQVPLRPFPVIALPDLIALKAVSGQLQHDADVIELLKRHAPRIRTLVKAAQRSLKTERARRHLEGLVVRAREELARR